MIEKAYYWFWHDICKRPEPFTYTMRHSIKENPKAFVLTTTGVGFALWMLLMHLFGLI